MEGIGGVERVDAPDYDPAKERVPFVLAEINRSLKGRVFPKCAGSDVEDRIRALTCAADVSGTEQQAKAKTKDSADFASEIQTAASDSIGVRKNEARLQETKTEACEKQKSNSEKKPQKFLEEGHDSERELQQKSPVEKRVDTWNDFCEKLTVVKNISRKSPAELLCGMGEKNVKGYIKLFGVTDEELKNAATEEEAIWNRLKSHPDYMAYLFDWNQMEQLLKFEKIPNTVCTDVPDQDMIDLVLRLGLMDLTVETVNRSKYLMLRQTKGMGEILAAHTEVEWKKLCEKAQTMEKQCMAIMYLYGVMSIEALCEKYQVYYGRNKEIGEIKRCVYLGSETRAKLHTGQMKMWNEAICLAEMQSVKFGPNDFIADWDSLEYRTFTAKERKQASRDCWAIYPAWNDLYVTLCNGYDIEESELKRWMYGEYVLTMEGNSPKELWKMLEMCRIMEDMRDKAAAEADYKARARIVSSLWLQGIKDVDLIAKATEFTTDQVTNILGSRYAEV